MREPIFQYQSESDPSVWLANPGPDATGSTFAGSGEAMFVPRLPRYWRDCQEPLMGWYDPAMLTLRNAPEPIHPENYPAMTLLPLPAPRRQYQAAMMDDSCYEMTTLAEAPHAEAMQPLAAPRVELPRRQQPPMERLDPAELDLAGLPTSLAWPAAPNQPVRTPPARDCRSPIGVRPFYFDHPEQIVAVWPPLDRLAAPERGMAHAILVGGEETSGDVSSSYAPSEPMAQPRRASPPLPPLRGESAPLSPDVFKDQATVDLGWWAPLGLPVRPAAARLQATGTPGELGSMSPASFAWPGMTVPAPARPAMPRGDMGEVHLDVIFPPPQFAQPSIGVPPRAQASRPQPPIGAPPEFTDVSRGDWGELDALAAPVRPPRPPQQSVSDVTFAAAFTPPVIQVAWQPELSRPTVRRPLPVPPGVEVPYMPANLFTTPTIPDALTQAARPLRYPTEPPPVVDPALVPAALFAAPFVPEPTNQVIRPPRGAPQPPIGAPVETPRVFQVLSGLDPMAGLPRAKLPPSPAAGNTLVVMQSGFTAPDVSGYHADWQVMRRPAPLVALRMPMESLSTTAFYGATGNPPAFTGSGQIIVTASDIWVFGATASELDASQRGSRA